MNIQVSFVETAAGRIHLARCGAGEPVLLLHQTPRSWDEYREVLPLLGARFDAIAMDTVGYGLSPPFVDGEPSIERWADAALALMDTLGIAQVSVVGHHTGAVIGMEIAARAPQRVKALVLSSCPMVDAHRRAHHGDRPVVDGAERRSDGGHLLDLWRMRAPFYPPADVSLLERFLIDALRAGERAAGGHRVVNRYCMETRVGLVRCPTLVIGASEDPHAFPAAASVAGAITGARRLTIAGGMVPLPDQMPETFARAVINFLRTGASEIS